MPKPVLSDSLFNADDVATALVNNYNLAVSNQDFAVTEISSNFSLETGWDSLYVKAFAFNGFVFINLECRHVGASPGTNEHFATNSNSNYFPTVLFTCPSTGWGGDTSDKIKFDTNGELIVSQDGSTAQNPGNADYHIRLNAFYRYA